MAKFLTISTVLYEVLKVLFCLMFFVLLLYHVAQTDTLNQHMSDLVEQSQDANERLSLSGYFPNMAEFLKDEKEKSNHVANLLQRIRAHHLPSYAVDDEFNYVKGH